MRNLRRTGKGAPAWKAYLAGVPLRSFIRGLSWLEPGEDALPGGIVGDAGAEKMHQLGLLRRERTGFLLQRGEGLGVDVKGKTGACDHVFLGRATCTAPVQQYAWEGLRGIQEHRGENRDGLLRAQAQREAVLPNRSR